MQNPFPTLLILAVLGLSFVAANNPLSSVLQANNPFSSFSRKNVDTINHCVYAYEDAYKKSTFYYTGDAAAFNETLADLAKRYTDIQPNRRHPNMTIVIHAGSGRVPHFLTKDHIHIDWAVQERPTKTDNTYPDLFIEVYANGKIKFDELVIPKGARVHTCGESSQFGSEVKDFVQRHTPSEQEHKTIKNLGGRTTH